jgi:uncharacterized protein (DUF58 family)
MRHTAEQAASAFPGLLIAAERIADAVIHGGHGRRRAGPGEDFWQYRPYSPGDAVGRIDWRRSAKRNRLFVRENEWAATNTLWSFVASGPGMDFNSNLSTTTKYDRAATIALALSILAVKAGERAAGLGAPFNPGHTRSTINRLSHWYDAGNRHQTTTLPGRQSLPRFASCVLLSDFLQPMDEIKHSLSILAANNVKAHVVQVLDPIEETFPFAGRTRFVDTASDQSLTAGRAENLRKEYTKRLLQHRARLRDLCKSFGWHFTLHHTDQPLHQIVLTLYHLIAEKAPTTQMTGAGG